MKANRTQLDKLGKNPYRLMTSSPKTYLLLLMLLGTFTALAQTTTPPAAKILTPAEQKRKDKLEKEIQEQRKYL
jgi:hypothetical protein